MSFSAEQFTSKLNTLEDSQESIASASKWLLSQYREADQVAECWKDYMIKKNVNTRRKLLAIYLSNHVVQQAKAKKIGHFQEAFGKVSAEVMREVYPGLPRDLKKKVKRVADIWAERAIFSKDVLKNIQASMKTEGPPVDGEPLPSNLRELAGTYTGMTKVEHNKQAIRMRFDKAIESLDPSSVVYEENLRTVSKIGQSAKDATSQLIKMRERRVSILEKLLREEESILDEERNSMNEIEIVLHSKDPSNTNQRPEDEDLLPTYEAGNDDDEDEDSSDDSANEDEGSSNAKDALQGVKRQGEPSALEDSENKRTKLPSEEAAFNDQEGYEPQNLSSDQNPTAFEGSPAVTSSIQDLLSKLAN